MDKQTKKRRLKVREVGDFYLSKTRPQLTLSGKWLEEMGVRRGAYVDVSSPKPGTLLIEADQ